MNLIMKKDHQSRERKTRLIKFPLSLLKVITSGLILSGCAPAQKMDQPRQEPWVPTSESNKATLAPIDSSIIPEPARSSDSLVDTIGVATHWGFHNTIYNAKWDELQKRLGESGIRYVRDGLDHRLDELWKMYGIRGICVTGPEMTLEKYTDLWQQKKHLIAAIEGPNEVNGGWEKAHYSYKGKINFPEGPVLFQNDLYKCIKENPFLKDIPVIAPSTAYKGFGRKLAPLRSFDFANTHCYASGGLPSRSLDFKDPYLLLGSGATLPPLVATESGYHTCLGNSKVIAGAQPGISHETHRKYITRQVAEYFNAGMKWAVIYEFAAGRPKKQEQEDPEAAFGLLMPNGTPKPAYFALKDLISILAESKWDSKSEKWIRPPEFKPQPLAYALKDTPETVHHTVLQRSDGTYQLLLWNEVSSFDTKRKKDIVNQDVTAKLVLKDKAEDIKVQYLEPNAKPIKDFGPAQEVELKVPDEVMVVWIKPGFTPPAAKPSVPRQMCKSQVHRPPLSFPGRLHRTLTPTGYP